MAFVQARTETVDLDVHDILHLFTRNLMENDHFIDAVDKFRAEALFTQSLPHRALYLILIHAIILMQPEIANVAGHDNHRILKSTVRPCPSVRRLSSSNCNRMLKTSGAAFSISSSKITL